MDKRVLDFLETIISMDDEMFEKNYEELTALFGQNLDIDDAIMEKISFCKTYNITEDDLIEENNMVLDFPDLELSQKKIDFLQYMMDSAKVINNQIIERGLYSKIKLRIQKINPLITIPSYAHSVGDSGMDVYLPEQIILEPQSVQIVKLGFKVVVPLGYELQMRPRSGNSAKLEYLNLFIANSPGTIDANYRGEVGVILKNIGTSPILLKKDMRIAQMVLTPVVYANIVEISEIDNYSTERGNNGWGSTGV